MRRRNVWTTAGLAVLLLLPALPASAAQSSLVSPDGDVTGAVALEVDLERDFGAERFRTLHATLRRDGEALGRWVQLTCIRDCDDLDRRPRYGLPEDKFDPRTGAPFEAEAPLANGPYVLRLELDKGRFQSAQTFEHELHLAVPPTAPKDLAAEVDGDEVELVWTPSPEPDIETYRVERHDGDGWEELTSTPDPAAVDEPGDGEHRYRVVALRSDGRDDTLETASAELTVEIEPDEDEVEPDDNGDDDADDAGSDGGNDAPSETSEDDPAQESSSAQRREGSNSSTARAPQTGSSRTGSVPSLDGDGYSTELNYGERDGEGPDDVQVAAPTGWRGAVDRVLDAERIAVPIATGLIMTAAGLHLWRWTRVPM